MDRQVPLPYSKIPIGSQRGRRGTGTGTRRKRCRGPTGPSGPERGTTRDSAGPSEQRGTR